MASWRGVAWFRVFLPVAFLLPALVPASAALAAAFVEVPATFGGTRLVVTGLSGHGQVLTRRADP